MTAAKPSTAPSPGPWTVAKSGVSVDAGPLGPRIRQENAGPREVLEANARLIAAAPELRALLREAVDHVGRDCACLTSFGEPALCQWLTAARALLERLEAAR